MIRKCLGENGINKVAFAELAKTSSLKLPLKDITCNSNSHSKKLVKQCKLRKNIRHKTVCFLSITH